MSNITLSQWEEGMSQYQDLLLENEVLKELSEQLQNDIINANMNLEIMVNLAEERRVALEKCSPHNGFSNCLFCDKTDNKIWESGEHESNCDYVRLIKQD